MENEKNIDCLLIGHNEMDFAEYERGIRNMGINSGAYRDLNLNFIQYNHRPYTLSEMVNIFQHPSPTHQGTPEPLFHVAETFSAAISYLGSYLHKNGCTFDYVKDFQYSKPLLAEKLQKGNVRFAAIITTLYVSMLPILEIIEFIKKHNSATQIIVGGPFISTKARTLNPEELAYLFQNTIGADFYVNSSQGEATLVKIIKAQKNHLPLADIPNIYYREGNTLKSTPVVRENNILAENRVDWSLFKEHVRQYANVRTAISCPFSCSFCGFPQHAGTYQVTPVEVIESELKKLADIGTVKSVHFIDDTLNIPVERFKDMLRMIIKNKFPFRWHSYFRCQFADQEMVELMKESGCEGVFLGIESGHNQILKNMNKAVTVEKYYQGIQILKKYGITTFGNFIIGFPGETEETLQATMNFIQTSGLDFFRVQLWYCEPITPIFKEKDRYAIKGESFEWSHATMNSQAASDWVEKIFLTIKNPTWIPQYNLDFDSIWHLVHRGMSIPQVKNLLDCFNAAVREKFSPEYRGEVSFEALNQLRNACFTSLNSQTPIDEPDNQTLPATDEADFDF